MKKLKFIASIILALAFTSIARAGDYSVIATNKIEWGLLNPLRGEASPKAADLWGDRTRDVATGMLVKFNKGFSSPPHIHNISYRGVVIEGFMHNDDPLAERTWLPTGSFWTQPAGEVHITAANGDANLIYLEIDSGPYLVLAKDEAFDNGERAINIDRTNHVWLDAKDITWVNNNSVQLSFLWGSPQANNGSFVKLPAGFDGTIESDRGLKAVLVSGKAAHQWNDEKTKTKLLPSSYFSSKAQGKHKISVESDAIFYINSNGRLKVK